MNAEELIRQQFNKASVDIRGMHRLREDEQSFGDFLFEVNTHIGRFRISRDRGQVFIDVLDPGSGACVRGEKAYPELLDIYERVNWDLWELLTRIKQSEVSK
jgi:hypothetical protein